MVRSNRQAGRWFLYFGRCGWGQKFNQCIILVRDHHWFLSNDGYMVFQSGRKVSGGNFCLFIIFTVFLMVVMFFLNSFWDCIIIIRTCVMRLLCIIEVTALGCSNYIFETTNLCCNCWFASTFCWDVLNSFINLFALFALGVKQDSAGGYVIEQWVLLRNFGNPLSCLRWWFCLCAK